MRSEHRATADETDAFSRFRHFLAWKPGERKRIKELSHRRDRRAARRECRNGTARDENR